MDTSIFFGGSVIAAMVAGSIALFAPCCISVMLPSYFASAFQNRRKLVAMTFLFAAGVATIVLPIALGAAVVQRLLLDEHRIIYTVVGVALLSLGTFVLAGGRMHLPMPGRRAGAKSGPASVYTLGVFSGMASSCCAPVLVGVIALSGLASSFAMSAGLAGAYVFGMVAPLFVLSLMAERFDWSSSRLLRPRTFTWRIGALRRTITGTALASGVLLILMALGTLYLGLFGAPMSSPTGWQASISAELEHYGSVITKALGWVPGWVGAIVLLMIVALLARRAFNEILGPDEPAADDAPGPEALSRSPSGQTEPSDNTPKQPEYV